VVSTLEALAGGDGAKAAPGAAEDFEATDGGDSGRGAEKDSHTPRMNVGLASPGRHRDHRRQRNGGPRSLLEAFGLILAMLVAGRTLAWRGLVPADAAATLNLVVLYVCLPAAVLLHAPHLRFERDLVGVVAVPWLILLASCALTLLVARLFRFERHAVVALLMLVALGNTSFLGFALVPALGGPEALRYAIAYDQFGSFLILSTFGLVLLGLNGSERPTAASILRRIVGFPPFIALMAGLFLMPPAYPAGVEHALRLLADSLLPLVALACGMQLRLQLPRADLGPIAYGITAKLVLMPALSLALCFAFGLDVAARDAVVYETAMPSMITAAALLSLAGIAPALANAMVGYGIVLSMLTLPLWHAVLARIA